MLGVGRTGREGPEFGLDASEKATSIRPIAVQHCFALTEFVAVELAMSSRVDDREQSVLTLENRLALRDGAMFVV